MLDWIIPLQLDAEAAKIIQAALRDQGIDLRFGRRVESVVRDGERVRYVELEDGTQLGADLVVVAAGVRANMELAQAQGSRRGGHATCLRSLFTRVALKEPDAII